MDNKADLLGFCELSAKIVASTPHLSLNEVHTHATFENGADPSGTDRGLNLNVYRARNGISTFA